MARNKSTLQYIPLFLDYCESQLGLSQHTQVNYQRYLRKFQEWLTRTKQTELMPSELTIQHIREYKNFLANTGDKKGRLLSPISQNYYLIAVRVLLRYFAENNINSLSPTKIKLEKVPKKQSEYLLREQVDKLLDMPNINTVSGLRDKAILELLFATGLRISELVALNHNTFHTLQEENAMFEVVNNGNMNRKVQLPKRAFDWIKKYLARRTDQQDALFINYRGRLQPEKRLTARSIERIVKSYALKAGIPLSATPNALRHSYTQELIKQSADIPHIQKALGHKSITITQSYIHRQFHGGKNLQSQQ